MGLPQGQHGAVGRVVFGPGQILQHRLAGRLELVIRKRGAAEDIGEDGRRLRQLPGHHRPGNAAMAHRDRLRPLHARIVEVGNDLAAVAASGAA